METYDVMRTTFAARQYTDRVVTDEELHRILENARFAPSGGNRQGWRVLIIRDAEIRSQLRSIMQPTIKRYKTQAMAGETPFSTTTPSQVTDEAVEAMPSDFPLVDDIETAPVILVMCVDLSVVSAFDSELDRVGVTAGASIYPFVWNVLLAARNEGLGGVLTTFLTNREPEAKELLGIPDNIAICSMVAIGEPVKQLTKLKRKAVEDFTMIDRWGGQPLRV